MEATMTHDSTAAPTDGAAYQPVGFGGAVARQLRLLWKSRRPLLLALGLIGLLVLAGEPWSDQELARLLVLFPVWLAFTGPLWAFAVWYHEGPSNRLYFWAHPVSRTGHTLARLTAGLLWLWAVLLLLVAVGYVLALFDGNAEHFSAISAPGWVSLFTGPLIGYLMISVLAVASDYPIRWFLGILFGFPLLMSIFVEFLNLERPVRFLLRPLTEMWGLPISAFAPFAVDALQAQQAVQGSPTGAELPYDPALWWITMPLWALFWVAVVVLVARRHPDGFPRLRRG